MTMRLTLIHSMRFFSLSQELATIGTIYKPKYEDLETIGAK